MSHLKVFTAVLIFSFLNLQYSVGQSTINLECCSEDTQVSFLLANGFREINNGFYLNPSTTSTPPTTSGSVSQLPIVSYEDFSENISEFSNNFESYLSALEASSSVSINGYLTDDDVCDASSSDYEGVNSRFGDVGNLEIWYHVLKNDNGSNRLFYKVSDLDAFLDLAYPSQTSDFLQEMTLGNCNSTNRFGNYPRFPWPGVLEHAVIEMEYQLSNPLAYLEFGIPGSSAAGNYGYADIADPIGGHIFEIKPDGSRSQGQIEISRYVDRANAVCPILSSTFAWIPGTKHFPSQTEPPKVYPFPNASGELLMATLGPPGVVGYFYMDTPNPQPAPQPLALPVPEKRKLKDFIEGLIENYETIVDLEREIQLFLHENPNIATALQVTAAAIIIGTLVEDIVTLGVGIADDPATLSIGFTLWRLSRVAI